MNNHHWCRRTVPAVLIAAVLGAAAHTASAAPTSDELAAARARLVEVTSQMPAGWPATEVMWEATEQPTLTAAELQRLQQDVARMPAGWPATEVMRQTAEEATLSAAELQRLQEDVARMPAGWPATEVIRRTLDAAR